MSLLIALVCLISLGAILSAGRRILVAAEPDPAPARSLADDPAS